VPCPCYWPDFVSRCRRCRRLFTRVVVYGDSLSDNGNLYAATSNTIPPPPYFDGRRSNGSVAVEVLAAQLGLPLIDQAWIAATTGLGNYGDGGTTTTLGAFNLPGVSSVFAATAGGLNAAIPGGIPSGIFVIWAGANDFLAPSPLDLTLDARVARSIANINNIVGALLASGATNILVPGMPNLESTPYVQTLTAPEIAYATAYTARFNADLKASLPPGVRFFNTSALLQDIMNNPAAYGFTNVTSPCFDGVNVCSTPDGYLFWDDFHPSAATHAIIGERFAAAIPEPGTAIVVFTSLIVVVGVRRRRKSAA
jgi:cholinesterase